MQLGPSNIGVLARCSLGMLPEGDRDQARFRRGLEQPGLRVQRAGRDLAGDPSLREGSRIGSEFPRCVHQSRQRVEGGEDLRSVSHGFFYFIWRVFMQSQC